MNGPETLPRAHDADALFAHLGELVAQLPAMQELDRCAMRAEAAEAVLACAHELEMREAMLAEADGLAADAERALGEAKRAGDPAVVDRCQREALYCGQQRGLRIGPVRNARRALEQELARSGFASVDEARAAALDEKGRSELRATVQAYQRDYAATLADCQELA